MSSFVLIGQWAEGVWLDMGAPSGVAVTTISGYVTQPSTLGQLNNRIGTCYSGTGYMGTGTFNNDTVPDIGSNELAIVEQMYLGSYYRYLMTATMGMGGSTLPWTNVREGDSSVSRVNAGYIGKEYREAAKDAFTQLNMLVNTYIQQSQGADIPRQVAFFDPPAPGYAGDGYGPIPGPVT